MEISQVNFWKNILFLRVLRDHLLSWIFENITCLGPIICRLRMIIITLTRLTKPLMPAVAIIGDFDTEEKGTCIETFLC